MRAIQDMVEIVVVVVHLRRRELALVHDVLGGERADVEALRERTSDEISPTLKLTFSRDEKRNGTNMV